MLWGVVLSCEHNALGVRVACVIQITLDIRANDFQDAATERLQSEHIRINAGTIRPHIDVHGLGRLTRQVPYLYIANGWGRHGNGTTNENKPMHAPQLD